MLSIIIGFVERLHDRGAGVSVSIADAAAAQLRSLETPALHKLREAANDLERVALLELGQRFDAHENGVE